MVPVVQNYGRVHPSGIPLRHKLFVKRTSDMLEATGLTPSVGGHLIFKNNLRQITVSLKFQWLQYVKTLKLRN